MNILVIGSGAIILGPITVGDGARVGAGSVVVKPVPPGMTVVGVPARITGPKAPVEPATELSHGQLRDPSLGTMSELLARQEILEARLRELERILAQPSAELPQPQVAPQEMADRIRESLRDVLDPEAGISVVELGLIRDIVVNEHQAEVQMVLTSGACPLADFLMDSVRRKAEETVRKSGIESVRVVLSND